MICTAWAETETVGVYTWTYSITGDTAEIYNNGSAAISPSPTGVVTIPSMLGGKPVTSIGSYAFYNCSGLTSVTIGDSVTSIGSSAFSGCSGLTSVTIPDSVTSIESSAFYGCGADIYDTATITGVKLVCGWVVGYTVSLPEELDLTGARGIGGMAFAGCDLLTSVTIPSSVMYIGAEAFSECYEIRRIVVDDDNANYKSVNGLLLTKDGKILVQGVNGEVTIPDSVTSIGDYAFKDCYGLTSVTIPNSVTNIGELAFYGCGLTSITIPDSVTSIGEAAFAGCHSMTDLKIGIGLAGMQSDLRELFINVRARNVTIPQWLCDMGVYRVLDSIMITNVVFAAGVTSAGGLSGLSDLESVYLPNGVTNIQQDAFHGCHSLKEINIPDSVTSIGSSAFYNCRGLTSVTIPDSVTSIGSHAFDNCSGLTSVMIPNSVTNIGEGAFDSCRSLTSVYIPASVEAIGREAFSTCYSLTNVVVRARDIGRMAFSGCGQYSPMTVEIGDGVANIDSEAFMHCSALTSVAMSNSVTNIGERAFSGCSSLASVSIPDSVTSIGNGAFDGCSSLTSVTIPQYVCSAKLSTIFPSIYQNITNVVLTDSVTRISDLTFAGCCSLSYIRLPGSVTCLGDYAFSNCCALANIELGNGLSEIGSRAFYDCSSLASVTIPDSMANIGNSAFEGCNGLACVTIPNSVTNIGRSAFSGCSGLTSVTIPDSVTSLGNGAFYSCTGLCHVVIGSGITTIEGSTFWGCISLKTVTIPNTVMRINPGAFFDPTLSSVIFMGDAPEAAGSCFFAANGCVACVARSSTGWNVAEGEKWNGLVLRYWSDDLPEVANDADVPMALAGSGDARVAANVGTKSEYDAYLAWASVAKKADGSLAGLEAVKASSCAWPSYVLGSERLFENEPTVAFEDVAVEGHGGSFAVEVVVKDGEEPVAVDIDNVAGMFEATSDLGDWVGAALPVMIEPLGGENATMQFRVAPSGGRAPQVFLRIRQ